MPFLAPTVEACGVQCNGQTSQPGAPPTIAQRATTMTMNGTYTMEKIEMTMAGEVNQPQIPGGRAIIAMKITSERAGDCKS